MSDVSNLVQQWLDTSKATGGGTFPATPEPETEARAENSSSDDLFDGEGEDTQADSLPGDGKDEVKSELDSKTKQATPDKEVVTVTDELGRKKKLEIDYSNKEAVKKAH